MIEDRITRKMSKNENENPSGNRAKKSFDAANHNKAANAIAT